MEDLAIAVHEIATGISDLKVLQLDPKQDDRGHFVRIWGVEDFASSLTSQLDVRVCNLSHNNDPLTLRGMHFQVAPYAEAKLVTCVRGAIYDVAIDIRASSPTRFEWHGETLSAGNHRSLLIPEGFAHGFLTLEPDTTVLYLMSGAYSSDHARGVRWDDPAFAIEWPEAPQTMSVRDRTFPLIDRRMRLEDS